MAWIRRILPKPAAWPPPREPEAVAAALRYARMRDPIGDRAQTVLAVLYLGLLPLGTSGKDIAWAALAACALLRLPFIWRCYAALLRDPLAWLLAAWAGWRASSLLWSPDVPAGFDELQAFRVLLVPLLVWPVLDRAPLLVAAFLAGVFGQNLGQLAQHLRWFGLHPAANQRLDAFLHAIQAGALCAAAVAWHLAALLRREGPRWLTGTSVAGLAAAVAGLVYSGSRGPWVAACAAIPLQILVTSARRPHLRRTAAVAAILGLAAAAVSWPVTGDFVRLRVGQAVGEVRRAWGPQRDYESETGQRLARWDAALRTVRERPLAGTGAGGFASARRAAGHVPRAPVQDHAHSLYLHEAATTGIPGAALFLAASALCLRRLWSAAPGHAYADGTLFVLAGWLLGAAFDSYQLSGTIFGLFGFVAALSLRYAGAAAPP